MRHTRAWTTPPPNLPLAALAFVAELVLWFGLGFATFDIVLGGGGEVLWAVVAGAGAMIGIVALWGTFISPRALRPLRFPVTAAMIRRLRDKTNFGDPEEATLYFAICFAWFLCCESRS